MDTWRNHKIDTVETVEIVKDFLAKKHVGQALTDALENTLSGNSSAFARTINGEPLFITVARHCAEFNQARAMELLVHAFFQYRELARLTPILKTFLLSNIINIAVISGLFMLQLSEMEISKVVHMAKLRHIIPDSWSQNGLIYEQWEEYSRNAVIDDKLNQISPAFKHIITKKSQSKVNRSQLVIEHKPTQRAEPLSIDLKNISIDAIDSIKTLLPLPELESKDWLRFLTHEKYEVRSSAAELVGIYVASGRRQYATIKMLMETARKSISRETYLRAIASSCIALARKSDQRPARFADDSFSQRPEVILHLTQQQKTHVQNIGSQEEGQNSNTENGVWSYLNDFNGLFILYSALFEAFREEEPVALLAAHHFQVISQSLGRTPWQICQPYWPWLAPKVVLPYDEVFVDWVCSNVLQVSREDFLLRTASFTIPHLCLAGKPQTKACEEIAGFRGCSVRRLYIDNTAAIVALFLIGSPFDDPEEAWEFAEERFMALDRSFRALEFNKIISTWRVELIYEVFMLSTNEKAALAIGMVNKIMDKSYEKHNGEPKELLQQTLFKLIVKFSDTMRNLMGRQSQTTKLSALTGLKLLIGRFLSPTLVASVLRQLTAFLQAALENNQLSLTALQTWLAVVKKLNVNKMEAIVDLTYAIINERIDMWDRDAVKCAEDIVRHIKLRLKELPLKDIKIHPQSVFDKHINQTTDPALAVSEGAQDEAYEGHACYDILLSLVERDTENTYIAQQTARDICALSLEFQSEILSWAREDGPGHELLGQAIRVLLNLCSKNDTELRKMSARALGLLGALDPHTTTISPKESTLIIVYNFQNASEAINFSHILVQDWLLPAFEAAVDPTVQRYVAYGIQELLKFMGIEEVNKLKTLFKGDGLVSTLLPLVKTKYTTDMKHWSSPQYPIYNSTISYSDWLIVFCSDMMDRTSDPEYATRLFTWCRKVLYGSSAGPEMWAFLFPYAALASVVDYHDSEGNRQAFLSEVLLVLGTPGEHLQPFHERIFAVFDYFNQWMRSRRQLKQPLLGMDTLLAKIPARLMAQRALDSGAYPRAIRYYEQQVREEQVLESEILERLRHMYASMQDVDSLEGISSRIPTLSVEQQVLEYRATSQWDAALACYNALPVSESTFIASLECLQRSGREHEVLAELTTEHASTDMAPLATECSWVVRDWKALEKWNSLIDSDKVSKGSSQLPPGAIQALGNALLSLHDHDLEGFRNSLDVGRKYVGYRLGDVVSTHHITSLRQVRDLMVYLHGLADIESLGTMLLPEFANSADLRSPTTTQTVKEQLDARLAVLSPLSEGPEFHARRFLLSLRAAALSCLEAVFPSASQLIAEAHIEISSAARHHGQPSISLMEIAAAKQLNNSKADIEHAHLLWSQGESRAAIRMLQSKIPSEFFNKPKHFPDSAPQALEWTSWRDIAAQADTKVIVENYNAVIKAAPYSAEAQYRLAKHYVKIYHESPSAVRNDGTLNKLIVHHFSKALELGTSRANEALPKMLTTWFDLGIMPDDLTPQEASSRKHCLSQANREIQNWGKSIDRKLIYTAIPQLLSRLNHPNKTVRGLVEQLIVLVLQRYPHHTLWPILEKGDNARIVIEEATNKIIKSEQAEFANLIHTGSQIVEKLKRICALKPKQKEVRLSELGEDFSTVSRHPSVAVPIQKAMDGLDPILIYQIEERVVIQQSLQRPKRIVVWGTNGQQYQLLLKGNDDVRKDSRLIEFTTAVNQLLKSDAAAASRHLDILTYRVTPLGASAGIIEWVNGAIPVRSIMYSLSRNPKLGFGSTEVKKMTNTSARISERLNAFHSLEQAVPPVLWEWFVDTFPDPEAWLEARTRYARTLAVMSMIGYLLGLGDRHLENILLLQSSGAVLHVDFDCLFDKGRHLAVPELVPFRLTQQFRDALGIVNKYEGPFRKVSELTLKIVRSNEDLLMVVLEAFIHDPVVQDRINIMQPRQTMERLSAKIRGIREPNSVPLSVGGLVDELIQVAVSPENLCQMFKGWMPWI